MFFSLPGEVKWYMVIGLLLYELGTITFMQVRSCAIFEFPIQDLRGILVFYQLSPFITFQSFVEWKSYSFRKSHSELLQGSGSGMVKKTGIAALLCICMALIQLYSRFSAKESLNNESYLLFKVKICCTSKFYTF